MSTLGGFAAVGYVPQQCIDFAIDDLWVLLWPRSIVSGSFAIPVLGGALNLRGGLEIDKPSLVLSAATPGQVSARVSGRGRFSADRNGKSAELLLRFDATVLVPLTVSDKGMYFPIEIDFRAFTIPSEQIEVEWSAPVRLPADMRSAVIGEETRAWLADQVRKFLGEQLLISIPFGDLWSQLTSAAKAKGYSLPDPHITGVVALDGWLAIGVDNQGPSDNIVKTEGDLATLEPPQADGATVFTCFDKRIVLYYLGLNLTKALRLLLAPHPTVHIDFQNSQSFKLEYRATGPQGVRVSLNGTVDAPSPFPGVLSLSGYIDLLLGETRVSYQVQQHVDVSMPWWLDVLADVAKFFGSDFQEELDTINRTQLFGGAPSEIKVKVPDMVGLDVYVMPRRATIKSDAIEFTLYTGPSADPVLPRPPQLAGATLHPDVVPIRARYAAPSIANDLLRLDPTYLVVFRVTRGSDNGPVLHQRRWSGAGTDPRSQPIDLWKPYLYLEQRINLAVSVERPPGVPVATFANTIAVLDKFDRSYPYVRWTHDHGWYDERVLPGTVRARPRHSAVHKTDIRARCKFCDVPLYSRFTGFLLEPLNQVPAVGKPGFKTKLCPYCFGATEIARWREG
jgi:hypothetical protein